MRTLELTFTTVSALLVLACGDKPTQVVAPPAPVNQPPEWTSLPALAYDVDRTELVLTAGGRDPEGKTVTLTCAGDVAVADSGTASLSVRVVQAGVLRLASEKRYRSTCTLSDGHGTITAPEAGTSVPAGPTRLVLLTDSAVEGITASAVSQPITVRALDSLSQPVAGVVVRYAAEAGAVAPAEVATNAGGYALTVWTLPDTARVATLTAAARDYPALAVRVSATAYPPAIDILGPEAGDGEARAVSSAGHVAGYMFAGGKSLGFLWKEGQALRRFDLSGASQVYPMSVNSRGVVVGWYQMVNGGRQYAFVYDSTGWRALPGLGGNAEAASYIDDSGRILGYVNDVNGYHDCVMWLPDGTLRVLASGASDYEPNGTQILPDGRVLGYERHGSGWDRPVIWDNGITTQLGSPVVGPTYAYRMNRSGAAVGMAAAAPPIGEGARYHAVLWAGGTITSLASPGELASAAYGIDDKGRVYGYRWLPGAATQPTAIYWRAGAPQELLPAALRYSSMVNGASDTGYAVGSAMYALHRRPVLWKLP